MTADVERSRRSVGFRFSLWSESRSTDVGEAARRTESYRRNVRWIVPLSAVSAVTS